MKSASKYLTAIVLFIIFLFTLPASGHSQESELSPAFTKEQLAQMLAPIALYPDVLLSQVLMASTYPIEVIEADRWVKKNPDLKGESLDTALLAKDWDPSVKALCHLPNVLAQMSERIGETTNIGNAFLAQEEDVMAMVQELRAKAYAQGNLKSSSEQKVVVEKQTIIIEPADPRVIYVPYYDPLYIYGPWWYPAYPPYYWGPPGVSISVGVSFWPGFFFSFGFGTWSYFDWPHHYIYIDVHRRPRYVRHDRWLGRSGRWLHVPVHRRGVAYRDRVTARKYGQYPGRFREFNRNIRGFPDRGERTQQQRVSRPQAEHARQTRQQTEQTRQTRQQAVQTRQTRQQTEQTRQTRQQAVQARQTRQQTEQTRQTRQQAVQARQTRQPVMQESRSRQQTGLAGQIRQRAEQEKQMRERSERNIFNRVDEGRMERESSKRGRMSRESRRGNNSAGRSRGYGGGRDNWGHGTGGGRDNRGRMRR